MDFETLKSINPRIISASVNGFGSKGEMSDKPAFDFIAQSLSGFMSLNGTEESGPMRAAMPISDLVAGLYCSFGIVWLCPQLPKYGVPSIHGSVDKTGMSSKTVTVALPIVSNPIIWLPCIWVN